MNKIIVLPGTADAVFFINEVDYCKKYFDEVIVISYPGNEKAFLEISNKKGFKYHVVRINVLKSLINTYFYKWLFDKNTRKEIKNEFSFSKQGLSKMLYILLYGLFYINAKNCIDREILSNHDDNIFMYSFWLSRGAYTIANYNISRDKNIKKIISRAHGYDLYEYRNKTKYLPFRSFIGRNLDEIYFISDHGLNYFDEKYDSSSLSMHKCISRLGTFNPYMIQKKVKNKKKICVASCSSIIAVKRLDLIIDVIASINLSVEWVHIGTGSMKDIIELHAAKKLKKDSYHFLGQIDNSEILRAYEKFDVDFFINMSDSEGIPVAIMESISMGIPVIARNVGGNSEIVNEKVGLLIEDISNLELVFKQVNEEIRQRIEDIELYKDKIENCMKLWDEKYNAEKNFDKFFRGIIDTSGY